MLNKIYESIKKYIGENYKFLIVLVLIVFVFTYQMPYVVYKPGGLVHLNDRIKIDNEYKQKGDLSMTYVSLVKGTISSLALSYLMPNWDIVSKKEVSDDKSVDELFKLERIYLQSSIDNATIVAYQKAGKMININKYYNNVIFLTDEANTNIKVYDKILEVEGQIVENVEQIKAIVSHYHEGDTISIKAIRGKKEIEGYARVFEKEGKQYLGIGSINTYEYDTVPKIDIKTKKSETGSSGGLMLGLEIYNKLTKEDITHGKIIAGTGTIDIDGKVGQIDGVKYKLLGAYKNKADIFLCPKSNYKEAMKIKKEKKLKIEIKSVDNFDEALNYLQNL